MSGGGSAVKCHGIQESEDVVAVAACRVYKSDRWCCSDINRKEDFSQYKSPETANGD
jgi:hypothetical protein